MEVLGFRELSLPSAVPGEALGVQGWVQTLNSQMVPDPLGHLSPKGVPEGAGEHEVLVKNCGGSSKIQFSNILLGCLAPHL